MFEGGGDVISCLLCFLDVFMVILLWSFHLSDGTREIPRYVYGSFWEMVGNDSFLKVDIWCLYML